MTTCGVVGLGKMGSGIAATLNAAGCLDAVWDLHPPALAAFTGAAARELAAVAACEVILLVVPGSPEIGALFGAGLLEGSARRVLVDLTTSAPDATRRLAARAAEAGAAYLDAGMSGGAAGAAAGRLTLMVGGAQEPFARARPVLDRIATRIFHVGPSGAGHTMKLVHNMVCHTIFLATAEGCRAAERAGVPLARAVEVINAGNARSFVSERRFPDHIISKTFDGGSHVGNLAKDLAMAEALFAELGQPARYVGLTAGLLAAAEGLGMSEDDFTRLYRAYDRLVDAGQRG